MHGLPNLLVSNNGPCITSLQFAEFCRKNGIKHKLVSLYHQASNGQAESSVKLVKSRLRRMSGGTLETRLSWFLLSYSKTLHTTTGVRPAELLMKRKLQSNLDRLRPSTSTTVFLSQDHQKCRCFTKARRFLARTLTVASRMAGQACFGGYWCPIFLDKIARQTDYSTSSRPHKDLPQFYRANITYSNEWLRHRANWIKIAATTWHSSHSMFLFIPQMQQCQRILQSRSQRLQCQHHCNNPLKKSGHQNVLVVGNFGSEARTPESGRRRCNVQKAGGGIFFKVAPNTSTRATGM